MPQGRHTALTIALTSEERQTLLAWQRSTTIAAGRARRGRMIVQLADGISISHIDRITGISRRFIYTLAKCFLEHGLSGLADKPGRGGRHKLRSTASRKLSR